MDGGGSMVQGQVFLKGHCRSFQGLSFLHLEIILFFAKLCFEFENELCFSAIIISWKKPFYLAKNEPENISYIKMIYICKEI